MAIGKTLVFKEMNISAAGTATTSGVTYSLQLTESQDVTLTPVTDTVEDGQTLVSAYDLSFSVTCYNTAVLNDSNVYTDASTNPTKANITLVGVAGAESLTIDNVILNGVRDFANNRTAAILTATKRTTNINTAVTSTT